MGVAVVLKEDFLSNVEVRGQECGLSIIIRKCERKDVFVNIFFFCRR